MQIVSAGWSRFGSQLTLSARLPQVRDDIDSSFSQGTECPHPASRADALGICIVLDHLGRRERQS